MCLPCALAQQQAGINVPSIVLPNQTQNCTTELSFLNYLVNLIDLNISRVSNEDKFQLQIYKGQIQSGINIQNYCYIDYVVVETNIFNVLSKYP